MLEEGTVRDRRLTLTNYRELSSFYLSDGSWPSGGAGAHVRVECLLSLINYGRGESTYYNYYYYYWSPLRF